MLIKEVCTITKITKKAIGYYEDKNLISPKVLENGYRDYNANDVEKLKKITILRKLGLGIDDIKGPYLIKMVMKSKSFQFNGN